MNPISTYRIQFHKGFTFKDFKNQLPYLKDLGVSTIYASPIFEATPGSVHGYDGIHPHRINPEIGTEEELREISSLLKEYNIQWVQDIVPNHMAFDSRNEWLMDVLEKGQQSFYATFFDTALSSQLYSGKIMVPFLGDSLEKVIEKGELKLAYENGKLVLKYFESAYPLHLRSYMSLLKINSDPGETATQLLQSLEKLTQIEDVNSFNESCKNFYAQFSELMNNDSFKSAIEENIFKTNQNEDLFWKIIEEQEYRLCHWQETDQNINYRRFFTVNGLICLNIQNEDVLQHHHKYIKQLLEDGIFQGLRIDHIDGLYDPREYLTRLRKMAGDETYIIVEKILEQKETLPQQWPIEGNSGYDFLALVNNLFTNNKSKGNFTKFYNQLTKNRGNIHQQLHDKKSYILHQHMWGELQALYNLFVQLNLVDYKDLSGVHPDDLKNAIAEFLIHCPVYRYYGSSFPLNNEEAAAIKDILNKVKRSTDTGVAADVLQKVFLHNTTFNNSEYNERVQQFYQRCMQFTGPLMAKGMEDTLMYTYNRFIGHNEVGDSPETFGLTVDEFHEKMIARQQQWPYSLNATSTHDTKRGEDVRARLNVLTDLGDEWFNYVSKWMLLNKEFKTNGAPDTNDEYLIYQSIVGAYPMPGEGDDQFIERLQEFLQKALREAKNHSNWTTPNKDYETATKEFAARILDKDTQFWKSFQELHHKIIDHGIINSLSQVILKFTCPGVPDVYQGTELWDFSFVDPDNRRPVDFEKRSGILSQVSEKFESEDVLHLWENRHGAQIKLSLVHKLLELRKSQPALFTEGDYIPLQVEGTYKENIIAFARKRADDIFLIFVPLHTSIITEEQGVDFFHLDWKDTVIHMPKEVEGVLENIFDTTELKNQKSFHPGDIFKGTTFAILKGKQIIKNEKSRGAGILMHISSLPSPFGIGDLGPEAKAFANFLKRSKQKYWQLLPLNPTEGGQGHSPYSATSSRAGNILFISPELLVKEELLQEDDIRRRKISSHELVDYYEAEKIKKDLLEIAYNNFKNSNNLSSDFETFCSNEKEWLQHFALFTLIKKIQGGKPWYEWPDELKLRDSNALTQLEENHLDELQKIKWYQYIFHKQWAELRSYCNTRNIKLIGDLPFYVSYDSADVWSTPEIFSINEQGERIGVAGVPPDDFSADGQLWGMPVFKWDILKEQNFSWWINRVKKNIELFDIIRIDHFRAFESYWEVAANETTAKNGTWVPGPASDFFRAMKNTFGELPFIAEDLGEVDEKVFDLRDEFNLPGMKILQFAFGGDMPDSNYIPHNYESNFFAYTGTHDNNTTRGWFARDIDEKTRKRIEQYFGKPISEDEISYLLSRSAYSSVAQTVIIPLQDILNLNETARMNIPASAQSNWAWRLKTGQLNSNIEKMLQEWVWIFNR